MNQNYVNYARKYVPEFDQAYAKFLERITIDQSSESTIRNYSRNVAIMAIQFNCLPQYISDEEINAFLYKLCNHQRLSISYFKHTVYALRCWFRTFGFEEKAIELPKLKRKIQIPIVLSKQECKELIEAPRSLKHRFFLALTYGCGLRRNEIRNLKISDLDSDRRLIHIKCGKGNSQRQVVYPNIIRDHLINFLRETQPMTYLFEGTQKGQPMHPRSMQWIIYEAVKQTSISKNVSLHTLRHSFASHLLEDGLDLVSIQHQLGHRNIKSTLIYLRTVPYSSKVAHSPLDSLYQLTPS